MKTFAYFESIEREILSLLRNAKNNVRICVAWINPHIFNKTFKYLNSKGVDIELIFNDDAINNKFNISCTPGITATPIKPRGNAIMHNKFCIIDDRILITGSYNWSNNAKNHYENIIVIEDNFQLVKSYLHEFYDLKYIDSNQNINRCRECKSLTFNIAVLSDESGIYNQSQVDIWQICEKENHALHLGEIFEEFLLDRLYPENEYDNLYDIHEEDANSMLETFKRERSQINRIQSYLESINIIDDKRQISTIKLHAMGKITMENFDMVNKGYENHEEWVLNIFCRDRWLRKSIPDIFYPHDGSIQDIFTNQGRYGF